MILRNYEDGLYKFFLLSNEIENYPSKVEVGNLFNYIEELNYLQMYYDFGEVYMDIIRRFMESKEEYEHCAEIVKVLRNAEKSGI